MKNLLSRFIFALGVIVSLEGRAALDFSGVEALADRLGGKALTSKVSFEELPGASDQRAVIERVDAARFRIRATSVHMASVALGVYLRDVAKGHISWCGDRLPRTWPMPEKNLSVSPRFPYAMAYNYCTLSYTMAFWGEREWRREIDRLALMGYSQALVMAGVQKVWQQTLSELGYSKAQQRDFIVDDASQAWWMMGNLQALGNQTPEGHYPIVSDEAIDRDAVLGRWLYSQMRAVGIEPVVQGFVGLIPSITTERQLAERFGYNVSDKKQVQIFRNGSYVAKQKSPDLLDPTCAAFKEVSKIWNENLKRVYQTAKNGEPKFLGGDLFHESAPPSSMTYEEKVNSARFIQSYQQAAFPGVIWVVQSWQGSPDQTLRDGLDPEMTLIQYLDQTMNGTSTRSNVSYLNRKTGKKLPWVWVEVMNFGGNTGMHGAFNRFRSLGNLGANVAEFKGYGLLSEGLETNPISYDLYHWAMIRATPEEQNLDDVELENWMADYRARRYGLKSDNPDLKSAYSVLASTVWSCRRNQQGAVENVMCADPDYSVLSVSAWGPTTGTPYDRRELVTAARHFLAAAKTRPELILQETFRYDFVEIFQQILADKAREILPKARYSKSLREEFASLLDLADRILSCSDDWRLDHQESRTVEKAGADGIAAYRRMITTWTPSARGKTVLSNYAHRSYAGLMRHYYARKWEKFFSLSDGLITPKEYAAFCERLDRDFPTMKLPLTPVENDPLRLAETILEVVDSSETMTLKETTLDLTTVGESDIVLDDVEVDGTSWIMIADETTLTLNEVSILSGELVIAGPARTVNATTASIKVRAFSPVAPRRIVYVCTDSRSPTYAMAQQLEMTSGGYLVPAEAMYVHKGYLTTSGVTLDWDLTLDQLAEMEYSCTMTGGSMGSRRPTAYGCRIRRGVKSVTLQLQAVDDGCVKGTVLTLIPVHHKVVAIVTSAQDQPRGEWGRTDLSGGIVRVPTNETAIGYAFRDLKAVPRRARLPELNANFEHVDTAIRMAALSSTKEVRALANDFLMTESAPAINLTIADGVALAGTSFSAKTLSVEGKANLENLVLTGSVTKTGRGFLSARLAKGAQLTCAAGTVALKPADDDDKIVCRGKTYACEAKQYLFYVTEPGAISVNLPGVGFETFPEALALAKAWQEEVPSEPVKIWVISQEVFDKAVEAIESYNRAHACQYVTFGDGNGIEVKKSENPR